jgi:hypothetical protein
MTKHIILVSLLLVLLAACGGGQSPQMTIVTPAKEATKPAIETTKLVTETTKLVTETTKLVTETTKLVTETTKLVTETNVASPQVEGETVVATAETEEITPTSSLPYPLPTNLPTATPPYPAPNEGQKLDLPPPPEKLHSDTTGAITGYLNDTEGKPIGVIRIYLVEKGDQGILSFTTDSKAGFAYEDGKFYILDVEPGTYALSVWTPFDSVLIPDPNGKEDSALMVDVKAGEVNDVGTVTLRRPR